MLRPDCNEQDVGTKERVILNDVLVFLMGY